MNSSYETFRYSAYLTKELAKRGAKTFGSNERKAARLQRFVDLERRLEAAERKLDQIRLEEQERVVTRSLARAHQIEREIADRKVRL
jgi:plasmid maintenance system antidote protein VapI